MTPNPTASEQLDFLLALFRPLLSVEEAAFILDDASPDHVRDLVEEGRLRAVDIASTEDRSRRCLRVYRYSAEHLVMRPRLKLTLVPVSTILPHERPTFLRRELSNLLGCTEQHVSNLSLPGPRHAGDARHRIYREAVIGFLTEREVKP
jgi:hypothetical protein